MNEIDFSYSKARRLFWTTVVVASAFGTFLPTLCGWNYRCDVLEQILVGRLWVPGSFKHPGLTTWIAEIFELGTFGADFAPYLASNVCVAATLWFVWRLSRSFMSERSAVLAALSIYLVCFFSSENHLFNNHTTLCCFWTGTILAFHRALTTNKTRFWLLSGAALGAAFLSKYTALVLALSIVLYLTTNRRARRRWKTRGPYLAIGASLAVFSLNLVFLFAHFERLSHYSQAASVSLGAFPSAFLVGWLRQLPIVAPVLIALSPLVDWRRWKRDGRRALRKPTENAAVRPFDDDFLAKMFFFPILIQTGIEIAILTPLRWPGYAAQFWPLLGATVLAYFPPIQNDAAKPSERRAERASVRAVRLVFLGIVVFFATIPARWLICVYLSPTPSGRYFDGAGVAAKIDDAWSEQFDVPPRFAAGDDERPTFLSWEYVAYSRFKPTLVSPTLGPWASDADVEKNGGVLLWRVLDDGEKTRIPDRWRNRFPNARFVETFDVKYRQKSSQIPRVAIGFAFVAPPND